MAKKVRWTTRALIDRKGILDYWIERNKSKTYSLKLFASFKYSTSLLAKNAEIGIPSGTPNVKSIVVAQNYLVFYSIEADAIYILTIWDTHRDPSKFKL